MCSERPIDVAWGHLHLTLSHTDVPLSALEPRCAWPKVWQCAKPSHQYPHPPRLHSLPPGLSTDWLRSIFSLDLLYRYGMQRCSKLRKCIQCIVHAEGERPPDFNMKAESPDQLHSAISYDYAVCQRLSIPRSKKCWKSCKILREKFGS